MEISISKLLGEGTLPQELVNTLQEAFDKKVSSIRDDLEEEVRKEFANRYEHDKNNLIEAMDNALSDIAKKSEDEKKDAVKEFTEARDSFRQAKKVMKESFKKQLKDNAEESKKVVQRKLGEELSKVRKAKKDLVESNLKSASQVEEMKKAVKNEMNKRVKKIDEFIVRQVSKELTELHEDHKALINTRVKLVSESRNKLRETQSKFIKESAKKVERIVNETLKNEMTQLHEDLESNRKNMFGRKIFESFVAEYMATQLNEKSELGKLQKIAEAKDTELKMIKQKLEETILVASQAQRKSKLAEDRAIRAKTMNELLYNLKGEKRSVMEGMLEPVKTEALRETFNKLLPMVIAEKTVKPIAQSQRKLVENTQSIVTGNRNNILVEDIQNNNDVTAEIIRLAGIKS